MSAPLRIEITDAAQSQIMAAVRWWDANRPRAPGAVFEDLDRTLDLLAFQPGVGSRARRATLSGVRRVTLSRIRYHLYYRVVDDTLQVLAFWHSSRGKEPEL